MRDTWKVFNFEENKTLRTRNHKISYTDFNNFLVSIDENIIKSLPLLNKDLIINTIPNTSRSFFMEPIHCNMIAQYYNLP